MATLTVNGQKVTVDDSFRSLPPEQQEATVNEIAASLPQQTQGTGGYLPQGFSGLLEGATGALGAPVDLVNNLIVRPVTSGINAVFGTDIHPSDTPLGGSAGLRQGLAISPPSPEVGPQMVRRAAQSVGGAAVPLAGSSGTVAQALAGLGSAAAGGAAGAVAQQVAPGNAAVETVAELLTGLGTGGATSGLANRSARKTAEAAVPTVEKLKQDAGDLYDLAEKNGVTASKSQTTALYDDFKAIAADEGLISPTGRVSEAYPKAKEALRLVEDYANGSMSPTQMQTVRKTLSDAAGSADSAESRIATIMLKKFDDFTSPLAPELEAARGLYSRAAKGGQLETARELAIQKSGQYSRKSFDDALKAEYGNLERKIIKGQERGWTPAQENAISKVAQGTNTQKSLRALGKLAPTGNGYGPLVGAGVPFMVGNAIGGPGVGSAVSAASMGTGIIANQLATRMGIRSSEVAEILARNGGVLPRVGNTELQNIIARALLGSNAAAQE